MSTYLPRAELTALLPSGHGYDNSELDDFIGRGSAMVDSQLAHLYWVPFTDYSANPAASPDWPVRIAAAWFAAYCAYGQLGMANALDDPTMPQTCWDRAAKILADYASGDKQLAPETVTEQLYAGSAWGDGDPYTSNQIALSVVRGEVICDSVRVLDKNAAVTDYQLGIDFTVDYHPPTRKWIFNRVDANICSQAQSTDGDKVVYEVSRIKKREIIQPGLRNVELRIS